MTLVRDRPFNLKGGGYGYLFRSDFFFRTTQELEYLFFLSRIVRIFFPEFSFKLNGRSLMVDIIVQRLTNDDYKNMST
jgi:hypothetical protein